jgi:hypothetical protein
MSRLKPVVPKLRECRINLTSHACCEGDVMRGQFKIIVILLVVIAFGGCTAFLPSFDGPLSYGSTTKYMPLRDVEAQIQCEVQAFVNDDDTKYIARQLLDTEEAAVVTFTYQAEVDGKASFIGVDLNKIGLTQVATLITTTNKVPSLQASLQVKGTVSDADIFLIPQVFDNVYIKKTDGTLSDPVIKGLKNMDCSPLDTAWPKRLFI